MVNMTPGEVEPERQQRAAAMRIFALSEWRDLQAATERLDAVPFVYLRKPETGLVMMRGRMGATGAPFNLGEATVTRCAVVSEQREGHGYVLGRNAAQPAAGRVQPAGQVGPVVGERHVAQAARVVARAQARGLQAVGQLAGEHLVGDGGEREQVGAQRAGFAEEIFRRRIRRIARDARRVGRHAAFGDPRHAHRTEVDDAHRARGVHHHVLGAQVAMQHLREDLGYDGVAITDDLGMGALSAWSSYELADRAIDAGLDLLMWTAAGVAFGDLIQHIQDRVEKGVISEARIDESVRRVLLMKTEWFPFPEVA